MKYNQDNDNTRFSHHFEEHWLIVPLALLGICGTASIMHTNNVHASNVNSNNQSSGSTSQASQSNVKSTGQSLVMSSSAENNGNVSQSSTAGDFARNANSIQAQAVSRAQHNLISHSQIHHSQLGVSVSTNGNQFKSIAIHCKVNGKPNVMTGSVNYGKTYNLYNWAPNISGFSKQTTPNSSIIVNSKGVVTLSPGNAQLDYIGNYHSPEVVNIPVYGSNKMLHVKVDGITGEDIQLINLANNIIPDGYKKDDGLYGYIHIFYDGPKLMPGSLAVLNNSQLAKLNSSNSKTNQDHRSSNTNSSESAKSSNTSKATGSTGSAEANSGSRQSRASNSSARSNQTNHKNTNNTVSNRSKSQPANSKAASNGNASLSDNQPSSHSQSAYSSKTNVKPNSKPSSTSKSPSVMSKAPSSQASANSSASKPNSQSSSSASLPQPSSTSSQTSNSDNSLKPSSQPSQVNNSANSSSASVVPLKPTYGTITVDYIDQNGQPVGVSNSQSGEDDHAFNLENALQSAPRGYFVNGVASGANVKTFNNGNQTIVLTVSKLNGNQNSQNNSLTHSSVTSNTNNVTSQASNYSNKSLINAASQNNSPMSQESTVNSTVASSLNGSTLNTSARKTKSQGAKAQAVTDDNGSQDPTVNNADVTNESNNEAPSSDQTDAVSDKLSDHADAKVANSVSDDQLGIQHNADLSSVNGTVSSNNANDNSKLPQTGESNNPWVADVSALLMLNALLLSAAGALDKRRHN